MRVVGFGLRVGVVFIGIRAQYNVSYGLLGFRFGINGEGIKSLVGLKDLARSWGIRS